MGDFFDWIVAAVAALIVVGVVLGISASAEQRRAFMAECLNDHKQYECVAMWRAGQ